MRIRNVKNASNLLKASKYYIDKPEVYKDGWNKVFKNDSPLMVEIGCGKGDFLIGMATLHPEWNFIGIEAYESVLLRATEKLENRELTNIRVICRNAENLNEYLGEEVDTIYLNFSDPWPKTRHHKRRLTYETFLKKYDEVFIDEAKIQFKTDNDSLFEDSLCYLNNYGYTFDKISLDLWATELENVLTEYEMKFSSLGYKIKYLKAHKTLKRVDKPSKI